jgi:glyoxylase-like metal-dependent hydrolase (beta-lactamase superfamily II)
MRGILPRVIDASNVRFMDSLHDLHSGLQAGLEVGVLARIAPGVQRLVAPNASVMTGPGTNSYVLGEPPVAVLDPGPDDPRHLTLLREAAPRLRFIFVTHTHRDHSCAARSLAAATGAVIVGLRAPDDGLQDLSCSPDIEPSHDAVFELSEHASAASSEASGRVASRTDAASPDRDIQPSASFRLRAIHTPGHASNHVCYLLEESGLEESGLLFSGDHVLEGVTPVILPPDGDMGAYLQALERLKTYPLRAIAPGHGRVMRDPVGVIDGVIAHRGRREAKVVAVLNRMRRGSLDELLAQVYDDVHTDLLPIARYSLEAHLIKLRREGRASVDPGVDGDRWVAPAGRE